MSAVLDAFRRRLLLFPDPPDDTPAKSRGGWLIISAATAVIYLICNVPAHRMLQGWHAWLAPPFVTPELFHERFVVPLRALLFLAALVCLIVPVGRAVSRGMRRIAREPLRRSLRLALALFAFCWVLCWPYHTRIWAVGNWGSFYARMTLDPFDERQLLFYRRLLKPALAYYLQLQGPPLYWVFSITCAGVLSYLIVLYLEVALTRRAGETDAAPEPDRLLRVLAMLAVMCTNVVMLHLAAPGYADDLAALLIVLQLVLPLTLRERVCLIALTAATHEAFALFGLGPLVLVLLPGWRERLVAWGTIAAFFVFWLGGFGFNLAAGMQAHTQFEELKVLEILRGYPGSFATGLFMAHKLLWLVFAAAVGLLLIRRQQMAAVALAGCTLAALGTIPISLDTSRLVGIGFAGVLFSIVVLLPELRTPTAQRLFALACVFTVLIPYFPSGASWLEIPAGGYYKAVYMYVRGWL